MLSDLDRFAAEIRTGAADCGALIIPALLSLSNNPNPVAVVEVADFTALVRHVRPRLVYLLTTPFNARDEFLSNFNADIDEASLLGRARVKKLVARWTGRDGQTCRLILGMMCDGVLHSAVQEASWFVEFESEVETISDDVERAREENERNKEATEKKRLGPMVKMLMADPRFSGPKVGRVKRLNLAGSLFPDVDSTDLRAVVAQAEAEHWLATAGGRL